jgi:nucleoside-diphosphate-sugar epimerase
LSDAEALRRCVIGASAVFHLAGGVRGKGSVTADKLNGEGTKLLVDACRTESSIKAFVFASTCSVYGDRSSLWVEEDFVTSPNTLYAKSKVKAENTALEAMRGGGLPVRIARIGAVYGKGFPFCMVERMQAEKAWLPGEGRNCIPVIHVDDCVSALIQIKNCGEDGGVYHVADRTSPSLKEFYKEIHKHVGGKEVRFWSTYLPSYIQAFFAAKNEAVKSAMGRKPRFTPDNLLLYKNSVRLKTDKLADELNFVWAWPDYKNGVADAFGE